MQELWHRPIVLMMVLAGAYFAVRTNRVFSQNLHNDTDVSFLFNRCGKPLRRAYAAGILMQAGESICFPFMIMLRMAIAAGGAGSIVWFAVFSLLLSFASINLRADQTIGGTALNMLAPALVLFLIRVIVNQNNMTLISGDSATWFMIKKTMLGFAKNDKLNFFQETFLNKVYLSTYICIIIFIVLSIVLYKTRFGLRLRACGEHPQAADSVGVNVYRMRYAGVAISGALAGVGGLVFVVPTSTNFNATVAGYGFLALAVLIFGQWRPSRILFAAFFFGLMKTVASAYSGIPFLANLGIPNDVYKMVPYVATLIVLAFTSKNSMAPRAEGIPYDKGSR